MVSVGLDLNTSVLILPHAHLSGAHVYKLLLPFTPAVFQAFLELRCHSPLCN